MNNWNTYCPGCYPEFDNKFTKNYDNENCWNTYSCYRCGIHFGRNDILQKIEAFYVKKIDIDIKYNLSNLDIRVMSIKKYGLHNFYSMRYYDELLEYMNSSNVNGLFKIANRIHDNMLLE